MGERPTAARAAAYLAEGFQVPPRIVVAGREGHDLRLHRRQDGRGLVRPQRADRGRQRMAVDREL